MCGLAGSLSLFSITAVFLSVCTIANSQTDTEPFITCQGEVVKLKCLNKSYIITIIRVFYGRKYPGAIICRSQSSRLSDELNCDQDANLTKVKNICEGQNSCNFTLNEESLGKDECPNVYKYIELQYNCVDSMKFKRGQEVQPPIRTPSIDRITSTVTSSSFKVATTHISSTEALLQTSTSPANVEKLSTIYQSQEATSAPRSSSLSSSRPHSVSGTAVSHTQRLSTTTVASVIESPNIGTTKPASKTYENSATLADRHGTMKLFRFIVSFHIIREENIHKRTASSVVWFMFGLLVGLFIMIAVLAYYRVKQAKRERQDKPNKAAYIKQKDCSTGTLEEKVILHPKELEALEMESQLGETV